MASTSTYKCKRCGDPFTARTADRNRGWARFCSKSCKAIRQTQQTQRTGRAQGGRVYLPNGGWMVGRTEYDKHGAMIGFQMTTAELSYGGYGDADINTPFGDGKW